MFLSIADVLSVADVAEIKAHLDAEGQFASGQSTAGQHARVVKNNEQATAASVETVLRKVEAVLLGHPVFKAAAQPKRFVKMMVSRYHTGMHYGTHVDDPLMLGVRTDLSFTLFLNPPESYDGGSLVVEQHDGDRAFKLPPGSLILYPTTTLHQVEAVTRGERLAIVGWVRSFIRTHEQRELVFDLENVLATLRAQQASREMLDSLYKVRANLLRMWVED